MIKKDSFADGIRMMNTKGALVVPVRLNKRMKEILLILIEEDKSNSEIIFEDCEDCYNRFMNATTWLFNQLNKNEKNIKIRFTKDIARTLHFWLCDKKYHHLFDDKDFNKAIQWVINIWNKKYSQLDLMRKEK